MADIFISYAREDRERVRVLVERFESCGWSVWWDLRLLAGEAFSAAIQEQLDAASCIVVIWSKASAQSAYVQDEANEARSRNCLVPVLIDEVTPPLGFRGLHAANLIRWPARDAAAEIEFLMAAIKAKVQPSQPVVDADIHDVRSALRAPIDPFYLGKVLRGRLVQVALDVSDLDRARTVAGKAAAAGTDLLEVGDPLIKRFGIGAIREIRRAHPDMPLVAELASSDWADDQIRIAAEAGADIVALTGLRMDTRIERAVHAARTCKVGFMVELPRRQRISSWCCLAQELGVDAIAVIRNIDSNTTSADSLRRVRAVRQITTTPIAVSGGFTPTEVGAALSEPWNIIIVGRAVVDAPDPHATVREIVNMVHDRIE